MTAATRQTGAAPNYAGDVSPRSAFDALNRNPRARLVDVRTVAEWSFVGTPDLRSIPAQPILVEWQLYPAMAANPEFGAQLTRSGVERGQPLYFICRSGARSRSAAIAATALGLGPCYNVAGGFEGNRDAAGHRGTIEGWKAAGLPWRQD